MKNQGSNIFSLENKVAIVTGALGLLGRNHCEALIEFGATVAAIDLDGDLSTEFARSFNGNCIGFGADITSTSDLEKVKSEILSRFGKIDILVNNAAINDKFENPLNSAELSKFENYPLSSWQKSIEVNLTGTFLCCQVFGTEMAKQQFGSIINISSTYGTVAPDQSLYKDRQGNQKFYKTVSYPVTKSALISLTKFLAAYWGDKNVRVNALSPGGVENNQDPYFVENYSTRTPLKRMARAFDYKGALVFLASNASDYMTGANLIVDGGWTIW